MTHWSASVATLESHFSGSMVRENLYIYMLDFCLLHLDVFLGSSAVAGPDGCEDDVYICKLQVPLVDDAADLH